MSELDLRVRAYDYFLEAVHTSVNSIRIELAKVSVENIWLFILGQNYSEPGDRWRLLPAAMLHMIKLNHRLKFHNTNFPTYRPII